MSMIKALDELPNELLSLKNPPSKLYYRGNLALLKKPKVAIIGSRKMSVYTKECVLELASLLSKLGVCVVSGGAIGVDINAHLGAMPCTIGVFANSLDLIYPQSNAPIIKQIYEKGLALSEKEKNYSPKRYDFLLRNRLIIALCEHIIIAEADLKSGSFASANLALDLGKKLFVLPQRKDESKGTNFLLAQNKARLIYDFNDYASHFGTLIQKEQDDAFLSFCKQGVSLEEALARFGSKVYEYELEGKIDIQGVFIKVLE